MRRTKKANYGVITAYFGNLQNLGKIICLFIPFFFTQWAQASDKIITFEKYEMKSKEGHSSFYEATTLSNTTTNAIPLSNGSYRITFLIKNFPKSLFTYPVTVKAENKVIIDDLRKHILPKSANSFKLTREVRVVDGRLDIEYIHKMVKVQLGLIIKKIYTTTALSPMISGGEVWKINFNGNKADRASGWNNFNTSPLAGRMLSNLVNSSNQVSSVDVKVATSWDSHNNKAYDSGNGSGIYPDAVMRSYFYTSGRERIRIGGLDPKQQYTFTFFGSSPHKETRNTKYAIGSKAVSLEASLNKSKTVSLKAIKPNADGYVYIQIEKGSGSAWGILNAMIIKSSGTVVSARISSQKHKAHALTDKIAETEESIPFTELKVYPNPAREVLYIETGSDIRYFFYNMQGHLLKTEKVIGSLEKHEIMISDLQPGMYLIRIDTESGTTSKKVILQP